jgi:4-carboxymuconolactone decarboxylase
MPDRSLPRPTLFRVVLLALGLPQLLNGVTATFAPRSFYEDFPLGLSWLTELPPYNEHLMTDVGTLFLATGVLMVLAAVWLDRRVVTAALVVWLIWALPHAVWHTIEIEPLDTQTAILNSITTWASVLGALALLPLLFGRRTPIRRAAPSAAASGEGTSRLPLAKASNPVVRAIYAGAKREVGRVPEPWAVIGHHPMLLTGYTLFEMTTMRSQRVDKRLKNLAELKAAQLVGCEWCLDFGTMLARADGVTDDEMRALLEYRTAPVFSDLDRLVIEYAEQITRTPVEVSDELFARLREHFDEAQIVELTSVIALENYRARFNWALGIGSEGYVEGSYCVPPQGADSAKAANGQPTQPATTA